MQPLVSICIPTFNAEHTIVDTLRSLLVQTYIHFEIIVVDNASTDNTVKVIQSIATDSRLKIIESEDNIGAEANFERCMHIARGKYTAIYHADDIYEPTMIEQEVDVLEANPDVGAVLTGGWKIDQYGNRIGKLKLPKQLIKSNQTCISYDLLALIKAVLREYNFLVCPSAMVRTEIYQRELSSWRGNLFKSSADLDVWFRIAQKHKLVVLAAPLINYRLSQSQGTYLYNQKRIEKADFLLVMDYWLQQENVKTKLTATDWEWYQEQERRDKIKCAARALLRNDPELARVLIKKVFNFQMLTGEKIAYQGLKFLMVLLLVKFLSAPLIKNIFKAIRKHIN